MGFILDVDLETSEGPSHEVYVRIESLTFNKVTMEVQFQLTYWQDKDYANRFNRTYASENKKNAIGLIQERVIYYETETSDGTEILFPHFLRTPIVRNEEVEVPKYEMKEVEKEVPYISFDAEGNEITKVRKVIKEEKVRVGVEKRSEDLFDYSALKNIFEYSYNYARKELAKLIPDSKIIVD